MLKAIKREVEECYELARGCAEKAKAEADPQRRQEFLDMERRWSFLAHSYEFTERLGGSPCTASLLEVSRVQRRTARGKEYQLEVSRIGGKAAELLGICTHGTKSKRFRRRSRTSGSQIRTSKNACSFGAPLQCKQVSAPFWLHLIVEHVSKRCAEDAWSMSVLSFRRSSVCIPFPRIFPICFQSPLALTVRPPLHLYVSEVRLRSP